LLKLKIGHKLLANFGWLLFLLISLLVVFQLKITLPVWKLIPLASFIQFPWRLSMFALLLLAIFGGWVWEAVNKKVKFLLLIVLLFQIGSSLKLSPADYFHRNIIDYDLFSQSTTTLNENSSKSFTYKNIGVWQPRPAVVGGKAILRVKEWTGSSREYLIKADDEVLVIEPTMNFAGWETWIKRNSALKKLTYVDDDYVEGRIAYRLEAGEYQIITLFTQRTWPRILGNLISAIAFLVMMVIIGKLMVSDKLNLVLSWRVGMLILAVLAPMFLIYNPSFPYYDSLLKTSRLPAWIYSWANFDGVHYLTIAQKGYKGTGLIQAFFPLFPLLLKFFSSVKAQIFGGLVLNFGLLVLLIHYWQKLLALDYNQKIVSLASLVLLLFPTSFFLGALYSETLFFLLAVLTFYSARKKNWLKASLFASLATATRVIGVLLIPALLLELWLQKRKSSQDQTLINLKSWIKSSKKEILLILLGSSGLVLYMLYLWKTFGDPLYFFRVQSEFGSGRQENLILYPQVVWRYLKIFFTYKPLDLKYLSFVQEFLVGIVGLLMIIWSWFRVRKSYVVFSFLAFLLPTLTGTFSSLPRYSIISFSIIILLAQLISKKKVVGYFLIPVFTLLLIFNTILFIQGYWVA
jgi:hypothetical protein